MYVLLWHNAFSDRLYNIEMQERKKKVSSDMHKLYFKAIKFPGQLYEVKCDPLFS